MWSTVVRLWPSEFFFRNIQIPKARMDYSWSFLKNRSFSLLLKRFTKALIAPANIHINFTIPYQRCLNSRKLDNTKNINSKNYTLAEETGIQKSLLCLTHWCYQGNTNKGRLTWKYLKGFLITETQTRYGVGCRRRNFSRCSSLVLQTAIAGAFSSFL